ncbi:ASF1 anti-silencing function 1 [Sparganum proliferum]
MTAKSTRDDWKQYWVEIATSMEQASDVSDTRKVFQLICQVSGDSRLCVPLGRGPTKPDLVLDVDARTSYQQPTAVCFVDFAAAFDSFHRESLWRIMAVDDVPPKIIATIKAYRRSTTTTAITTTIITTTITTTTRHIMEVTRSIVAATPRPSPGLLWSDVITPLNGNSALTQKLERNIIATDPRVTRFPIDWGDGLLDGCPEPEQKEEEDVDANSLVPNEPMHSDQEEEEPDEEEEDDDEDVEEEGTEKQLPKNLAVGQDENHDASQTVVEKSLNEGNNARLISPLHQLQNSAGENETS